MTQGVLCCGPDGGGFKYHTIGIGNAFKSIGIKFENWDGRDSATIERVAPKVYLACSEAWRWNYPHWARMKYGTKILVHVNAYGTKRIGSVDGGPPIDAKPGDIKWTLEQKPDGVFCYADDTVTGQYFSYWTEKHGLKVYGVPTAADHVLFKMGRFLEERSFDVGWVGGLWPYKAKMMSRYLMPLMNLHKCGFYGWNDPWKMGPIVDEEVRDLYRSCKICPSVSESHTSVHPLDVPQRPFSVICSGGFTIHTPTPALVGMGLSDVVPTALNVDDWFEKISYYIKHDEEREALRVKQKIAVMERHTYLHRITPWVVDFFPESVEKLIEMRSSFIR